MVLGQSMAEKRLSGKIVVDSIVVEKVTVLNTNTQFATTSNKEGLFFIKVKLGDELVLTAVNLEPFRKKITQADLISPLLVFKMKMKMNPLNEVKVNDNAKINAEDLSIIPHGQKKYSAAERKLYTSKSWLLDPLLNKMSGRTTMLKKEVRVEQKEKLLLKFDGLYEEKYYTEVLKIPQEYIKGFQYYLIEDPDFSRALQEKNKTLTMFYVKKLALNYNEIIQEENK
jgi:hypothetical protein